MAVNAEVLLRSLLADDVTYPVLMDVPADRPERFATIERTSGGRADVRDMPVLAVQFWAPTRYEASEMARIGASLIESYRPHPNIGRLDINSTYNFPDPESGSARYQVVVEMVTVD